MSKRKLNSTPTSSVAANKMNFRPAVDSGRNGSKGTKPLPDPSSIPQVLLLMVVHVCRRILFVDPSIKVGIYILAVFIGSILSDVLPIPRTYFSRKDNLFNVYFVKLSWGWTISVVGAFVYLTSSVYCCGERIKIRQHVTRLVIATLMWFFWTKSFVFVEEGYGYCSKTQVRHDRKLCLSKGLTWHSFSISGHTFILIYCTLIIMEEAKALVGWEGIKDFIRMEDHNRTSNEEARDGTALELLTEDQFVQVKEKYEKYTPYVRFLFIAMAVLSLIWDVMLTSTVIYFHTTPEKFLASVVAVLVWFFTYRFWFINKYFGISLPGEGLFRYMNPVDPLQTLRLRRRSSISLRSSLLEQRAKNDRVPMFMGMPLYALKNANNAESQNRTQEKSTTN
nr:EOG090X07YX [Eulimnadia texana]